MNKGDVPEHWKWRKLEEIGDIYSGGTPDRDNDSYFGGNIPWLRLKDVKSFYVDSSEEYLTKEGLNNSSAQIVPEGTVIVSTRATIGEVAVSKCEVTTNQGFKSVKPKDDIPEFIAYYLLMITDELERMGRTTTYPEVNKTQFSNIEIPIPPLDEQREIVAKLDSIFDKIESLREAYTRIDEILEELPDAATGKAFRGELIDLDEQVSEVHGQAPLETYE